MSPFLNIGVTELNIQIEGKLPSTKDLQYNKKIGYAIKLGQFAKKKSNISFKPGDLDFIKV